MFVYQVILLSCIVLAVRVVNDQNLFNVQAVNCCNPPYSLQNGICVLPSGSPCQTYALGTSINLTVNIQSLCATSIQSTPCLNQPIGCNVHGQLQPTPCINQQPVSYALISKLPINSSSSAQSQLGGNQPTTPSPPVQPQHNLCPNLPVTTSPPVEVHTTSLTTPSTTTYSPDRQATIPSLEPLRRCPQGTILLNGKCRLVYCGSGVPVNGRCVQPRCSPDTIWTGLKCALPSPIELASVYLERTIINEKSNNLPDVLINNVQNLLVNATIVIQLDTEDNYDDEYDYKSENTSGLKCCTVVAPRVCRCRGQSRVCQCYNEKQKICSDFCTSSKVVIAPSKMTNWLEDGDQLIVIPPEFDSNCRRYGNCTQATDRHDCRGCATSQMMSCSSYCYMYRCSSQNCHFYDQQEFCKIPQSVKSFGCRPKDGWNR